jgi:hypothetical protein
MKPRHYFFDDLSSALTYLCSRYGDANVSFRRIGQGRTGLISVMSTATHRSIEVEVITPISGLLRGTPLTDAVWRLEDWLEKEQLKASQTTGDA